MSIEKHSKASFDDVVMFSFNPTILLQGIRVRDSMMCTICKEKISKMMINKCSTPITLKDLNFSRELSLQKDEKVAKDLREI